MANMMSVEIENLETSPSNYRLISFPQRVQIESVSFAVNSEAAGEVVDARVWRLYAVVGSPAPTVENPFNEIAFPLFGFFGPSEKPVVTVATSGVVSTISETARLVTASGDATQTRKNVVLSEGLMAPGDYLALWIQADSGDFDEIDYTQASATISISYSDTTGLSPAELVRKYPNID